MNYLCHSVLVSIGNVNFYIFSFLDKFLILFFTSGVLTEKEEISTTEPTYMLTELILIHWNQAHLSRYVFLLN